MIIKYDKFIKKLNEMAAPRVPNSLDYWLNKGKKGKEVVIYTHDDLDGIFSAIAIKKYLLSKGFEIKGYGIVNYQESWRATKISNKFINVAVDFADYHKDIDIYIDHHGEFKDGDDIKGQPAVKTQTGSAYEGIMDQLGLPVDSLVLSVIDMVDSAKYDQYGVKWTDLLDYNIEEIKKKPNAKLLFAGVFNQMIKRGDHRTLIEVIHNATEPSVYQLLSLFKVLYPANNKDWRSGEEQEFMDDSLSRLEQVKSRSRGTLEHKDIIKSEKEFLDLFITEEEIFRKDEENKKIKMTDPNTGEFMRNPDNGRIMYESDTHEFIKMNGYCVIGDMVYMPTGTWSNPIRSRSIVQQDIESGLLNAKMSDIKWVFLIYGDTYQIVSFGNIQKDSKINSLKDYTNNLLQEFRDKYDYYGSEDTTSGGHIGIGTISNIGTDDFSILNAKDDKDKKLLGFRFLDLFKNRIISDLSGIKWDIDFKWIKSKKGYEQKFVPIPKGARMMTINQIRTINPKASMTISYPDDYEEKPTIKELQNKAAEEKAEKERIEQEKIDASVEAAKKHHLSYSKTKDEESDENETESDIEK